MLAKGWPAGGQTAKSPACVNKQGFWLARGLYLERDKRLELSTYTLARYRSTN
jgi:hypothetical protein